MRVSKRPYGGAGPLSTHTEVKPQAGTSLESIKSPRLYQDAAAPWVYLRAASTVVEDPNARMQSPARAFTAAVRAPR